MLTVDKSPLPQEVRFIELDAGKVHVERTPPAPETDGTVPAVPQLPNGQEIIDWLLGKYFTRCGLDFRGRSLGRQKESAWITDQFADERLCQNCFRSVPQADRPRLFEHRSEGHWQCPDCLDWFGPDDEMGSPPVCDMCKKAGR